MTESTCLVDGDGCLWLFLDNSPVPRWMCAAHAGEDWDSETVAQAVTSGAGLVERFEYWREILRFRGIRAWDHLPDTSSPTAVSKFLLALA